MVSKFKPELNKAYFITSNTMFHVLAGNGAIEVDFKQYYDWDDKLIFLEQGQYIKFLSSSFEVRKVEFEDERLFKNSDVRVLFKHLVSLGYINLTECSDCKNFLDQSVLSKRTSQLVDICSNQWYWQNPFQADQDEYHVIFDVKDVIDQEFKNNISTDKINKLIGLTGYKAQALVKDKIGISVKSMLHQKRHLESKKEIAFSMKSIKEIAYDLGFKDPAYFNRVFSKYEGLSPQQFRELSDFEQRDHFTDDLYQLLKAHHKDHRQLEFYAHQLDMPVKKLSAKVKQQLNTTLGRLIRLEIVTTAKALLLTDIPIKDIAFELGFEEANHFSTFFKNYVGLSPVQYKSVHLDTNHTDL